MGNSKLLQGVRPSPYSELPVSRTCWVFQRDDITHSVTDNSRLVSQYGNPHCVLCACASQEGTKVGVEFPVPHLAHHTTHLLSFTVLGIAENATIFTNQPIENLLPANRLHGLCEAVRTLASPFRVLGVADRFAESLGSRMPRGFESLPVLCKARECACVAEASARV
jgi:hypothetical protein